MSYVINNKQALARTKCLLKILVELMVFGVMKRDTEGVVEVVAHVNGVKLKLFNFTTLLDVQLVHGLVISPPVEAHLWAVRLSWKHQR